MEDSLHAFDDDSLCLSAGATEHHSFTQMWVWLATLGLVFCVCMSAAWGETIYINDTTGAIIKDGKCSISEAIENANTDTQINLDCPAGKYDDIIVMTVHVKLTSSIDSTDGSNGTPSITSPITLDGQELTLQRISDSTCTPNGINKSDEFRLLHVASAGNLTLQNISLNNGCADGIGNEASGGTVFNRGTLTVLNTTFIGNQAGSLGGGLFNLTPATVNSIVSSAFIGNMADDGGGIYNYGYVIIKSITNSIFSNNSATWDGGGLYNYFTSTVTSITHSTFLENSASSKGGAIYNDGGIITTITNNILGENSAGSGGGIFNRRNGKITTIADSIFTENSASYGGGLYNDTYARIGTIDNNTFSYNLVHEEGAGIYNRGTLPILANSTFLGNSAGADGAGIYNIGTLATLANSTFSGNSSNDDGGGIFNNGTLTKIANSTFSGNLANQAAGLYNTSRGFISNFTNNIITNSNPNSYPSTHDDCVNESGGTIGGGTNLLDRIGDCPMWLSIRSVTNFDTTLADNGCVTPGPNGCVKTHALLAGSNAINKADSGTMTDQRGFAAKGIRDIGAYEYIEFIPSGNCVYYSPKGKSPMMICW